MNPDIDDLSNQALLHSTAKQNARKWRNLLYIFILIDFILCIFVLSLDVYLANNGLNSTKKYLGFCQSVAGMVLVIFLTVSVFFRNKTLVLVYIVIADIISIACGVMFILLDLSADIQYYNGEAPLAPAHTKVWFKVYQAYFIVSLTLASFTIFKSFFSYKVRTDISIINETSPYLNANTRHSSSKMIQENLLNKPLIYNEDDQEGTRVIDQTNNIIGINIQHNHKNKINIDETDKNIENYCKSKPDKEKIINDDYKTTAIDINESQEKSLQNSPPSSKKMKIHNLMMKNCQGQMNSISEEKDDKKNTNVDDNKVIVTRTMMSEINRQEIESFLLDTPSEVKNI